MPPFGRGVVAGAAAAARADTGAGAARCRQRRRFPLPVAGAIQSRDFEESFESFAGATPACSALGNFSF